MKKEQITSMQAIRKKCVEDCCAGDLSEVRNCLCTSCPLFEFRMGKNPYATRKSNPDVCAKMRAARTNKNKSTI